MAIEQFETITASDINGNFSSITKSINDIIPDTYFKRYGENYVPSDTSNAGWNSLGLCMIYYTQNKISNQPTTFGQLINIPADSSNESTQIWVSQPDGYVYSRGGNGFQSVNSTAFLRYYDSSQIVSGSGKSSETLSVYNSTLSSITYHSTTAVSMTTNLLTAVRNLAAYAHYHTNSSCSYCSCNCDDCCDDRNS